MKKTTHEVKDVLITSLTDEEIAEYSMTLFSLSKKVQDKIVELQELIHTVDHKILCTGGTALVVSFKCGPDTAHCAVGASEDVHAACIDLLLSLNKGGNKGGNNE